MRKGGSKPGTITSTITCSNSSFTKGKSVAIVGSTSTKTQATTFDVLLKDANTWYFVGVPTGDATHCASSCNCNVRKVNMYNAPKSEAPTLIETFSFEADLITLLQSIAMYEPQQSIKEVADMYIAKNTSSRLYNGLYWGTSTDLAAPDKSYSNIKFTYTCPTSVLNRVAQAGSNTTLRAILSGYKVVVNGKETDFKHTFNNSIYSESGIYELLNLAGYGTCGCGYDVSIYPIWEALNVYSVQVSDSDGTLGFDYKRYALEGRTITYSWDLSSISIATSVSTSTYDSRNLYTMYSTKRTNYVLSGLTLNSNPAAYSTSPTDTEEFKNYGVLRVVNSSGAYSVKQNNNGSVVSGGKLSFTVRPEQNMTFYAIWLRRGYTIKYQYNGKMTYGMSGTKETIDNFKITSGQDYEEINYESHLEGVPIKIAQGFNLSLIENTNLDAKNAQQGIGVKSDILLTDGCTIDGYYSGKTGSTKWSANNLKAYSDIAGGVVGFSLSHSKGHTTDANGSLVSSASLSVSYGCGSGDHTEYKWLDWDCYYCKYAPDTNQTNAATERVYSDYLVSTFTGKYSAFNGYCMRHEYCKRCGKTNSGYTTSYAYPHGDFLQETGGKAATCTTNKTYYLKCSRCGYDKYKVEGTKTLYEKANSVLGHRKPTESGVKTTYSWVNSSDCTKGYTKTVVCNRLNGSSYCTEKVETETNKTKYTSHAYDKSMSDLSTSKCGSSVTGTCTNKLPDNSAKCTAKKTFTKSHLWDASYIAWYNWTESNPDPWHCRATMKFCEILCANTYKSGSRTYTCGQTSGHVIRVINGDKSTQNNQIDTYASGTDMHDRDFFDWGTAYCNDCVVEIKKDSTSNFWEASKAFLKDLFAGACYVAVNGKYNKSYDYIFIIWWESKTHATLAPGKLNESTGLFEKALTLVRIPVYEAIPPYKPTVKYIWGIAADSYYLPPPLRNSDVAYSIFAIQVAAKAGFSILYI